MNLVINETEQKIIKDLLKGDMSNLLEDMHESKYEYTVDDVKALAEKLEYKPTSYEIDWEGYRRDQII